MILNDVLMKISDGTFRASQKYKPTLDKLTAFGYIVHTNGNWEITESGEMYLKTIQVE